MKSKMQKALIAVVWFVVLNAIQGFGDDSSELAFGKSGNELLRKPAAYITTEWITQKLDHFNKSDTRTWQMRYLSNDQFFTDGGPIFIIIGTLAPVLDQYLVGGHLHSMAKEHNGYLFLTEYRYYGESRPTLDLSTPNLKYFTVRQALADLANFIRTKKAEISGLAKSKVILAGGRFSGSMVVWLKRLYPELIDGGWASSAPLLAKLEFEECGEVVGETIREFGGQQCYNRIQNGIAELENMFDTNNSAEARDLLQICDDFDVQNHLDVWTLFGAISLTFTGAIQAERNFDCSSIMQADNDVAAVTNYVLQTFENPNCLDITYRSVIEKLSNITSFSTDRLWFYQACNELGWFVTSKSRKQPFGTKFPVTLFTVVCADLFGQRYTKSHISRKIRDTNAYLGGLNPNVQNVYRSYGELDTWRPLGYQTGVTVIPRALDATDFESISPDDSLEMRDSKEEIAALVRQWVRPNEHYIS